MKMMRTFLVLAMFASVACATMGEDFQFRGPQSVVIGKTTKAEIRKIYGEPFRVGYDSGDLTWTYGYYKYRVFGDSETKDLIVTFDANGTVKDYSFNSSVEDDKKKLTR